MSNTEQFIYMRAESVHRGDVIMHKGRVRVVKSVLSNNSLMDVSEWFTIEMLETRDQLVLESIETVAVWVR